MTPYEVYFSIFVMSIGYFGSLMYGDIVPYTNAEEILTVIIIMLGTLFVAFFFAEIASLVESFWNAKT